MKTIHKLILPLILIGCLLFTACKDDDNENLMTAKQNAEKIENYGVTTAYFHSSTLATATQEKIRLFRIELPYVVFNDDAGNAVSLPLTNLLNITYNKTERYLILYFE